MPKQFDAATKHLVEAHPQDWLTLAGLPAARVRIMDADLSAITSAADKVLYVQTRPPYLAHLEFQASADRRQDVRVSAYAGLLRWRHDLPVRSVVFLLRPQAQSPGATGRLYDMAGGADGAYGLDFRYRLVRVWEQPVATMLGGGLGTLPLSPIAAVAPDEVRDVIHQMDRRLTTEAAPAEAAELRTAAMILLGLRHPPGVVRELMRGVRHMKESSTYRMILEEGEARGLSKGLTKGLTRGRSEGLAEGRVDGARAVLFRLAASRFGPPDARAQAALDAVTDLRRLALMACQVLGASGWDELLRPRAARRLRGQTK